MNKVSVTGETRTSEGNEPLLDVRALRKSFSAPGWLGSGKRMVAVDDVSFSVGRGDSLAIVGESGSGKSTVARMIARLETPDSGELRFDGEDVLVTEKKRATPSYRRRVQMVFQDPFASLNPVHSILSHLAIPLTRLASAPKEEVRARSIELLRQVGLEPANEMIDRMPHELSGGQRQRVAIARALAASPELLIADEPTSMLDVSIRTGVLELLAGLRRDRGLSILLITHDLAAAKHLADRVLVLYKGRVVEQGSSDAVVREPLHPYTRALIDAVTAKRIAPSLVSRASEERKAAGGCPYAPRCQERLDRCESSDPTTQLVRPERLVRCHLHPAAAASQEN